MNDQNNNAEEILAEHGRRRREFVVKSAKVAVTAPAISLLLATAPGADAATCGRLAVISGQTVTVYVTCDV